MRNKSIKCNVKLTPPSTTTTARTKVLSFCFSTTSLKELCHELYRNSKKQETDQKYLLRTEKMHSKWSYLRSLIAAVLLGQIFTYFPGHVFIRDWESLCGTLWVGCCSRFVMNECWCHWPQIKNVCRRSL